MKSYHVRKQFEFTASWCHSFIKVLNITKNLKECMSQLVVAKPHIGEHQKNVVQHKGNPKIL